MAGETILVVDDTRENREFIFEYVLKPNGYLYLEAKDGKEGLDMALAHQPDLILLDYQMPRMSGVQVLEALAERNQDFPVILMTFHGSEEIAVEVFRLGVRDYVRKPFSVDEMLESIEKSLTEVRLRREKEALTERVLQANRQLQKRLQELNVMYSVGKSVTALTDMALLLPRIVDAATQVTQAEEGYIHLIENGQLINRAHKRANTARAEATATHVIDPVAAEVIKSKQPVVMTPEEMRNSPDGRLTTAAAPLIVGTRVIGVLGVSNVKADAHIFNKQDTALLSALTDYAAIAIENSRNYEELRAAKDREKAQIRGTFERFVPPSIVERVLNNPDKLMLGGKRQEISVLFADIRGYTTWSENAPPEKVVEMLNDYLSIAAEVILGWEGTLDKFFGDGLMAIFNAPEDQPDHVHRAADAALALMRAAEEINQRRGYKLAYSVGVNVGEAVVGYIGTDRALNYTAIGDVVNLAKRMQEGAAPGQILVEEAIIRRLGKLAQTRPLGEMPIRGRKKPAYVYELQGLVYPE